MEWVLYQESDVTNINEMKEDVALQATKPLFGYAILVSEQRTAADPQGRRTKRRFLYMKKGLTEMVFILDRSGSMAGLESDTIGGFNGMLNSQRQVEGEAVVTTVLFDDQYELLHDRIPLAGVAPITDKQYYVRGCTALLDAVGRTIQKIANVQDITAEEMRAEKVIFVITTDGMENASQQYSADKVRQMIKRQQEKYGWEFLFLGANIDALETAEKYGIDRSRAAQFHNDAQGVEVNYRVISETVGNVRRGCEVPDQWNAEINADYASRC